MCFVYKGNLSQLAIISVGSGIFAFLLFGLSLVEDSEQRLKKDHVS
jgi:hypothetical protein